MKLCRNKLHPKLHAGRCVPCRRASWKAVRETEQGKKKAQRAREKHYGVPGSAKREAYNEARRVIRKVPVLQVLEASRKHRESLREFITRKVA